VVFFLKRRRSAPLRDFLQLAGFTRCANRIAYAPPLLMEKEPASGRKNRPLLNDSSILGNYPMVFRHSGKLTVFIYPFPSTGAAGIKSPDCPGTGEYTIVMRGFFYSFQMATSGQETVLYPLQEWFFSVFICEPGIKFQWTNESFSSGK